MRKVFYISDVHGCIDELRLLVVSLNLSKDDTVVFIGDLINKGPDSAGVLSYVAELKSEYDVIVIRGNHEEKMLRFNDKYKSGGIDAISSFKNKDELLAIYQTFSSDNISVLRNTRLYFRQGNYLAVHAGVPPVIRQLPNLHNYDNLSKGHKRFFGQLLRVRFVSPSGTMVSLGTETDLDKFWAEVYDSRFGTVVYGHQANYINDSPKIIGNTIGIDLGCVYGGRICAIEIDIATSNVNYHTVKAFKQYAVPREVSNELL